MTQLLPLRPFCESSTARHHVHATPQPLLPLMRSKIFGHELKANKRLANKPHTAIIIHSNITIQVIQAQASRQLYPAPLPILTFTQCHGQHQYFCQSVCGHLGCRVGRSPDWMGRWGEAVVWFAAARTLASWLGYCVSQTNRLPGSPRRWEKKE